MVTIVGAGLVGSLWSLLLQKKGYKVTIFERRPDPRTQPTDGGRSINLIVTSRGLYALQMAELLNEVTALAVPVYGRMIHSKTGALTYQPYGREDECNLSISRGDLNCFLISEAEKAGVKFHFEHEFKQLDQEQHEAVFSKPLGPVHHAYDILFAADGAGSRVRKWLSEHPSKESPTDFSTSTDWLEADYKELTIPKKPDGGAPLDTKALHIWPRGAHMMMALANRDGSFTVTAYLPQKASSWSFEKASSPDEIRNLFQSEFSDAVPLMPDYLNEFMNHPQGALGTVHCSRWVFSDSIALIGDAAHAIVPFFGQGMNCGFEDCTLLMSLIERHAGAWPQILKDFENQQKPNADAIAAMAVENWVEMRDKVADQRFLLRKKVEAQLEEKYPELYKSRYGLITYTLTPYALAQKAGLLQNKMIDQIIGSATSLEQVSWETADRLIEKEWKPFVAHNRVDVKRFPPSSIVREPLI
jgi:kynurenine 3-monooxygenase